LNTSAPLFPPTFLSLRFQPKFVGSMYLTQIKGFDADSNYYDDWKACESDLQKLLPLGLSWGGL
jgi:hypothetical protein